MTLFMTAAPTAPTAAKVCSTGAIGIGIPKDSTLRDETAPQADKLIRVAQCSADKTAQVRDLLARAVFEQTEMAALLV